ncbi:fibroleukin-like [Mya arenaria]|uniref:fibroleukin-like n=1 Tax=Mya arenaria TaxID=6604 RepID=UPI0022E4F15C|nr:fibroleukin-like [Mya arenaria]
MGLCKANLLFVILTSYTVLFNRCANTNELLMQTFSKVLSLDNELGKLDTEFKKSLTSLDERMDNLEIKLENSLTDLQTQLAEGLERIAETQKNCEPKQGGITNNIPSTIPNTVTQMVKTQFIAISTSMKREKVALRNLKTEMNKHMKAIDSEFQNTQKALEYRFLNQSINIEDQIRAQKRNVSDVIKDVIIETNAHANQLKIDVVNALSGLDERFSNQTKELNGRFENQSEAIGEFQTNQENRISSLNSRMSSTEGSLQSYKSSCDSIWSEVSNLETRVSSIEKLLSVDGQWGNWMGWTKCDTRCKTGQGYRSRECNNPVPLYGGASCSGEELEIRAFADCSEIRQNLGSVSSGVYLITTWKTNQHTKVFCDMDTDQGGWTVFQHRVDGSVDFYRDFSSYEDGFGSLQGEFWLGLKLMHEMTSRTAHDLRIDITRANDSTAYVVYADFSVGAGSNYTLHVGNALSERGLAVLPDGLQFNTYANGSAFTTFDDDNDDSWWGYCAVRYHGAWWYRFCTYRANLNGLYYTPGTFVSNKTAMIFDSRESLKTSRMMFRPSV